MVITVILMTALIFFCACAIYPAVGTRDAVKYQSIDMAEEMLSRSRFPEDRSAPKEFIDE